MCLVKYDIETPFIGEDGNILAIPKIFCIGVQYDDQPVKRFTNTWTPYSDGNLQSALSMINAGTLGVGHNVIKFDNPVITNLLGQITIPIHDTLILAKLMFTEEELYRMDLGIPAMPKSLYGSHSLKAFGLRLGILKGLFEDFTTFSKEMVDYMEQDVLVTTALYGTLRAMPNFPSEEVIKLENDVACITFQQERNGFYFDIEKAREYYTKLKFEKGTIERKLQKQFRPIFLPDGPIKENNSIVRRKLYIPSKKELKW